MASPLSRVNVGADAWESIWSFAHRVLVVNVALAVAGLPLLLALGTVTGPQRYPVFFGLLALPLEPVVAAACGYFAIDDPRPSLRSLIRLVVARARRSFIVGLGVLAVSGVLLVDLEVLAGTVAVPPLVVLTVLVAGAGVNALALAGMNPELPVTALLRLAIYSSVRAWPLTLLSLGVVTAALAIVSQAPVAGLATVPGCALWVVQTNTKLQLDRILSSRSVPPCHLSVRRGRRRGVRGVSRVPW